MLELKKEKYLNMVKGRAYLGNKNEEKYKNMKLNKRYELKELGL